MIVDFVAFKARKEMEEEMDRGREIYANQKKLLSKTELKHKRKINNDKIKRQLKNNTYPTFDR